MNELIKPHFTVVEQYMKYLEDGEYYINMDHKRVLVKSPFKYGGDV